MPFDDPTARPDVEVANQAELVVIDRMLALLRTPQQWCKGREQYGPVTYCLIGAFSTAKIGNAFHGYELVIGDPVWARMIRLLRGRDPVEYNDAKRRRHADILGLLRRTRASFE